MERLRTYLKVKSCLLLFLFTLRKIGYKIVYYILNTITTDTMFMTSFFNSLNGKSLKDSTAFQTFQLMSFFTNSNEKQNSMPFFGIKSIHEDRTYISFVYRKLSFKEKFSYIQRVFYCLSKLLVRSLSHHDIFLYPQIRLNY